MKFFNSLSLENISLLVDYILKETNSEMSREFIIKTVSDNMDNLDNIINEINNNILNNSNQINFESSLATYFSEDKERVYNMQELLKTPLDLKYFKDISAVGLIGSTSIEKTTFKDKGKNFWS